MCGLRVYVIVNVNVFLCVFLGFTASVGHDRHINIPAGNSRI